MPEINLTSEIFKLKTKGISLDGPETELIPQRINLKSKAYSLQS